MGGREGGGWEGGRAVDEEREKEGVWGVEATKPAGCGREEKEDYVPFDENIVLKIKCA